MFVFYCPARTSIGPYRHPVSLPVAPAVSSTGGVGLRGGGDRWGLTLRCRETGGEGHCDGGFRFLFLGASPNTGWLPKEMVCDERGFVKTGTDIAPLELVKAGWSLDRMPSRFETSWPRIYAVGDVRKGSVKRVARSEEHTSELQSLMRISYAVFCLKKKNKQM